MRKVVIIGGGISGLAAAHYFRTQPRGLVDFRVLESSSRLGGKFQTVQQDGFTIEAGPDSFIVRNPAVLDLCRALGLEDQLISANRGGVFVWTRGRLVAMPEGLMMMAPSALLPFVKSNLISWPGKIRMGLEALIPGRTGDEDESLAAFVRRRLGQEALEKIAGPLFAGIHSGDPEKLSLRSTFPLFAETEQKYGSLLRGMLARRAATGTSPAKTAARSPFLTLRGGIQKLSDAIVAELPFETVLAGEAAASVTPMGQRFQIALQNGGRLIADDVLFATPAYVTANLVEGLDSVLADRLRSIPYASTVTVSLAFRRNDIPHPLNGAGFIVAYGENRRITACTWSSIKFADRAPDGFVLLRVFMGGVLSPALVGLPDNDLIGIARRELGITMGIQADPVLTRAFRFMRASPQYEVGHAARVSEIEKLTSLHPGLHLAGAAYRGSGIPDCIESGIAGAKRILERPAAQESELPLYAGARMETK